MKLLSSFKYHIFALLGFLTYVITSLTLEKVSYFVKGLDDERRELAIMAYTSEGLICGLLAYILSNILLYYVEKAIDFGNLKKAAVRNTILVFIGVQALYSLILWPVLGEVYFYFLNKYPEITWAMKLTNLPFFATIFIIWFFVIIAIKVYIYINQVKISRIELESNLRESQLNTLKGQINPHFMFNSLNNIRGLILEDAPRSRDMITRLSEMLRYSLTINDVNTIFLKEELQTVDNYIEISRIQFEERLTFNISVNPETLNLSIPPMIIQMLVENAVKHGIGKLKQGGEVRLSVDITEGTLAIVVANSGQLTMEQGGTRLGLENIKKRLALIYGDKATFSLQEISNFVEAKICIPL